MLFNKKQYILYLIAITPILFSCKTYFPEPQFADFEKPQNSKQIFSNFLKHHPQHLSIEQSVLITIGSKKIISIGLCRFDINNDEIALALITTTGMKILELSKTNGKTTTHFAISEITNKKNASKQLIKDIENIYFSPSGQLKNITIKKNRLIYNWSQGNRRTELLFGRLSKQSKINLLIKKIYTSGTLESVVYYSDYNLKNGKNIPMTIHYENRKFDYSLILKTKQIYYDKI